MQFKAPLAATNQLSEVLQMCFKERQDIQRALAHAGHRRLAFGIPDRPGWVSSLIDAAHILWADPAGLHMMLEVFEVSESSYPELEQVFGIRGPLREIPPFPRDVGLDKQPVHNLIKANLPSEFRMASPQAFQTHGQVRCWLIALAHVPDRDDAIQWSLDLEKKVRSYFDRPQIDRKAAERWFDKLQTWRVEVGS